MSGIILGIIGGGQLGSMLSSAAKKLNVKTIIYCDDKDAPGQNFCDEFIYGSYEDKKKNYVELEPELRIYNQPITITSEADIKTTIYSDKFLVMNKVKGDDYFNVRYQVKPFMIWIWISTFLLAFGGSLSLFRRLNEK